MTRPQSLSASLALFVVFVASGSVASAQYAVPASHYQNACAGGCTPGCGCGGTSTPQQTPYYSYPQQMGPQQMDPQFDPGQPSSNQFQDVQIDTGVRSGNQVAQSRASAPHMIGDFFGPVGSQSKFFEETTVLIGGDFVGVQGYFQPPSGGTIPAVPGDYGGLVSTAGDSPFIGYFDGAIADVFRCIVIPTPGSGGMVGRVKAAENNMALPMDRIIFDYNYFHNVPLSVRGVNVNRFTPGIEKTITCGGVLSSIEVLFPMAVTLDSDVAADVSDGGGVGEFGNITILTKTLLWDGDHTFLSGGLGITLPTSSDINVSWTNDATGDNNFVSIDSGSVHLAPYLAVLHEVGDTFFHGFAQVDFDLNGNRVYGDINGSGLLDLGTLQDQTLLFLDAGVGHWCYRSYDGLINGFAITGELHYANGISDADYIFTSDADIGDPNADIDLLNATIGAHVRCGSTNLTCGYSAPLTASDRVFDGEFRCFINQLY